MNYLSIIPWPMGVNVDTPLSFAIGSQFTRQFIIILKHLDHRVTNHKGTLKLPCVHFKSSEMIRNAPVKFIREL